MSCRNLWHPRSKGNLRVTLPIVQFQLHWPCRRDEVNSRDTPVTYADLRSFIKHGGTKQQHNCGHSASRTPHLMFRLYPQLRKHRTHTWFSVQQQISERLLQIFSPLAQWGIERQCVEDSQPAAVDRLKAVLHTAFWFVGDLLNC